MAFTLYHVPELLAGVLLLALAALLLRYGFLVTHFRAFALFLVTLGVIRLLGILHAVAPVPWPEGGTYWARVAPYFGLADEIALVAFASVYPLRARWLPPAPWTLTPFLAAIGLLGLAYASDPSLYLQDSPLGILDAAMYNAYAIVPLFLVWAYASGKVRSSATSVVLVAMAVALVSVGQDSVRILRLIAGTYDSSQSELVLVYTALRLTLYAVLVAWVLRLATRAEPSVKRTLRTHAALPAVPFVVALAALPLVDPQPGATLNAIRGFWHGVSAVLITVALLRGKFLDLDLKIRWTISKSTVAAAFIAVFFIASELAQEYFGETLGSAYVGIAAAGTLVFALAPLQRAAERLAERAVPIKTEHPGAPDAHERYRILLRRVLRDGVLSRDEELALAHAAAGMGIPAHEALRLKHEAEDEAARVAK